MMEYPSVNPQNSHEDNLIRRTRIRTAASSACASAVISSIGVSRAEMSCMRQ